MHTQKKGNKKKKYGIFVQAEKTRAKALTLSFICTCIIMGWGYGA
jgi:hypothetical protein